MESSAKNRNRIQRLLQDLTRHVGIAAVSCCLVVYAGSAQAEDGGPPGGEDTFPPGGEVFHDFGITALEITPVGEGLYDVDVEVTVVPEAPPTQDIQVQLLENGASLLAQFSVPTLGMPAFTCCVSTCGGLTGYTVKCTGECVVSPPEPPKVCRYTKKQSFSAMALTAGSQLVAVADPLSAHAENAADAALSNIFVADVPEGGAGDVFHDFGITDVRITPSAELFDVDIEITIVPQGPPVQDIAVRCYEIEEEILDQLVDELTSTPPSSLSDLADLLDEVARSLLLEDIRVPTLGLPPYTCCIDTCAVVSGYTFSCGGECVTGEAPRVCQYKKTKTVTNVALTPGYRLFVIADPEALHFEAGAGDGELSNSYAESIPLPGGPYFRRGDANNDGSMDMSDAIYTLGCLFLGQSCSDCDDATDANDDGAIDLSDPTYTLGHIFQGGTAPPPPFAACGGDPTPDGLGCASYGPCL